ncbi:hypothetical protein SAY87_009832 [Trapa incisa]|uniref:Tify domain-containing protein n=1 Tax=Trapa incisa TaxID=236973 RepID=A0AAN7JVR8_9MYRT|nr:hypothetical protein SAY87_009832 [Trapa incisa]
MLESYLNTINDQSSRTAMKRSNDWIMDVIGKGPYNRMKRTVEVVTRPSDTGVFHETIPLQNKNSGDPLNSGIINDQLLIDNIQESAAPIGRVDDMNWVNGYDSRSLSVSNEKENPVSGIQESRGSPFGGSNNSIFSAIASSIPGGAYENYNHYNNMLPMVHASDHRFGSNISGDFPQTGERFMRTIVGIFNQEYGDLIRQKSDKAGEHVIPFGLPNRQSSFKLPGEYDDNDNYEPVKNPYYDREPGTSTPTGYTLGQETGTPIPMASSHSEANISLITMFENYSNNHSNPVENCVNTNIGYRGFLEGPAAGISSGNTNSYMTLNRYQNPVQAPTVPFQNASAASGACPIENGAPINPRKKTLKKGSQIAPDCFPVNVRNLLSTGIFDGVPVKYISFTRDKSLRGVISGNGYLCSCKECNNQRIINAYEYEQHAGCKTKHPNNHIFFENGKTVYAVVLELRKTPPEMLFEKIQTVAGSPINKKNFLAWKVSYEAAANETKQTDKEQEAYISPSGMQPAI